MLGLLGATLAQPDSRSQPGPRHVCVGLWRAQSAVCGPTGAPAEARLRGSPDQCPSAAPAAHRRPGSEDRLRSICTRASSCLPRQPPPKGSPRPYYVLTRQAPTSARPQEQLLSLAAPRKDVRVRRARSRATGRGASLCDGRKDEGCVQVGPRAGGRQCPAALCPRRPLNLSGLQGRPDPRDKAEETQTRSWPQPAAAGNAGPTLWRLRFVAQLMGPEKTRSSESRSRIRTRRENPRTRVFSKERVSKETTSKVHSRRSNNYIYVHVYSIFP